MKKKLKGRLLACVLAAGLAMSGMTSLAAEAEGGQASPEASAEAEPSPEAGDREGHTEAEAEDPEAGSGGEDEAGEESPEAEAPASESASEEIIPEEDPDITEETGEEETEDPDAPGGDPEETEAGGEKTSADGTVDLGSAGDSYTAGGRADPVGTPLDPENRRFLAAETIYADYDGVDAMDMENCWYFSHLSQKQQGVYAAFECCSRKPGELILYHFRDRGGSAYTLPKEEVEAAYMAFLYDHPDCYWMTLNFAYSRQRNEEGVFDDHLISGVQLSRNAASASEAAAGKAALEQAAESWLSNIDLDAPESVIALEIHDQLIDRISYDDTAERTSNAHNAYGALVDRGSVCDGYSLAYKYLLQKAGIQAIVCPGTAGGVKHGWNIVRLGGSWYETDCTHDDFIDGHRHDHYNLTTGQMSEDYSRGGSGGMQIGSLCPQAEGTYYDYTYMSAGIQMEEYRDDWHYMQYSIELEEGRDSRDNPIRLMLYKDGSYLSPEEDPDADTWKVTAAAMLDPVTQSPPLWRASGSSENTELVKVAEDWTAENGYVTYERAGGEGAQAAISVRMIFDNGASALLEDSLLVGRDGWVRGSGGVRYLQDGSWLTGFHEIDGSTYYFGNDTWMRTGWNRIRGKWYYFSAGGQEAFGFTEIGGHTFHFGGDGVRTVGWAEIDGHTYYFGDSGEMRTGTRKIEGRSCTFDSEGKLEGE